MDIRRINTYFDSRFSQKVLFQHGCFLADGQPCEVEIVSDSEAIVRGGNTTAFEEVIEDFRFYTPHITKFFDENGAPIREFPDAVLLALPLAQLQPSQFYVDQEKIVAISSFIHAPRDIIIQAAKLDGQYVSLDGHTRLYYAVTQGWDTVRAVEAEADDYISDFVREARARGIFSPRDMLPVSHREYEEKWYGFCDAYFERA